MKDVGIKFRADMSDIDALPNKVKTAMDGVEGAFLLNIAGKIGVQMSEVVRQTVAAAQKVETLGMAFEALAGSAAGGEAVMGMLEEFAKATPFQLDELAAGAKQILLAGVSVDNLQGELKILGNIAAVSGVSIAEIANIYQKMGATGKVGAEEMNQLARAGVPIYDALAEVLGVAKEAVGGLVTKGKVGFPEIQAALNAVAGEGGKFGSAMDKMAASGAGMMSTLLDNWEAVKRAVGKPLNIALKPALSGAISVLGKLGSLMSVLEGYTVPLFGAGFGAVLTGGIKMAQLGLEKLRDTLLSLVGASVEMGRSVVASNMAVANSARAAAVSQSSVVRSSFSVGKLSQAGTTVLPSYSNKPFNGASTLPAVPIFDMSKKVTAPTSKLGDVASKASKSMGVLGTAGAVLSSVFGPVGLAMMGAGVAIGYLLDEAGRQEELRNLARSLEDAGVAAMEMSAKLSSGGSAGISSEDELAAKLKQSAEELEKAQEAYAKMTDKNVFQSMAGAAGDIYDTVFNGGIVESEEARGSLVRTIASLERYRDDLMGISALDIAMEADRKAAADAERRDLQASEEAIKRKIDSLKGLKESYEKAKKSEEPAHLIGVEKLNSLKDERSGILKGRDESALAGLAEEYSQSDSGEKRLWAVELYEGLTRVLEINKAIAAEEAKQAEAMKGLDKQYALEVTAIEEELAGHQAVADSIRDRIAVEELALQYREAGLEASEAEARAEDAIMTKRRLALQSENQEREKERVAKLADLAQERAGLLTRELGAEGGFSSDVVGIVERMDGLMEKYGAAGMKSGDAMRMALREGGLAAAEKMKGAMLAGAVSSTRAIGGGGRYEQTKPLTIAGMEKQVKELVAIRDGIKELKGVGGL